MFKKDKREDYVELEIVESDVTIVRKKRRKS